MRLLKQRCERFRHIGKAEFIRLFDAISIAGQLSFLERQVGLECLAWRSARGRFVDPHRRHTLEKVDLAGEGQCVVELLTNMGCKFVERRLVLGALDSGDVLDVLDH